jgi:zinc-ribbon family
LLILFGLRVFYRSVGQGTFHCQRCGGDREYRHKVGRRWFTLFFIPVIPLNTVGEHVQCTVCGTRYRMEVLALPTAAQMQEALPAGMRAAVVAMLRAGGGSSAPARRRAIDAVKGAGLADYDDATLDADLSGADLSGSSITVPPGEEQPGQDLAGPLNRLTLQLAIPAREWFLAEVVRIGLADGMLSDEERRTAQEIAAQLGMTPAQARGVISMTEEGASA